MTAKVKGGVSKYLVLLRQSSNADALGVENCVQSPVECEVIFQVSLAIRVVDHTN